MRKGFVINIAAKRPSLIQLSGDDVHVLFTDSNFHFDSSSRVLFILCITPNIINGFHISSYVFLSKIPESYFCVVPALNHKNWNNSEIREIAIPGGLNKSQSCDVYKWEYDKLADLTFEQAKIYIQNKPKPEIKTCFDMKEFDDEYAFHYEQAEGVSFVPEWNLVCERTAMRSNVQVALSIGKFVGASTFGIISDK